jgi:hypothetical protein
MVIKEAMYGVLCQIKLCVPGTEPDTVGVIGHSRLNALFFQLIFGNLSVS